MCTIVYIRGAPIANHSKNMLASRKKALVDTRLKELLQTMVIDGVLTFQKLEGWKAS